MKNNFQYWLEAKNITPRRQCNIIEVLENKTASQCQTHTDFNISAFVKSHISQNKLILSRFRSCATDQKRRAAFERRELSRRVYKSALITNCVRRARGATFGKSHNIQLNRYASMQKVNAKTWVKKGTLSVVRNRCIVSGMNTVVSKLGLSRICFRRLAGAGSIPGLIKI